MSEREGPEVYSIAAHRGFADALVAGLVPRYADPELGLAGLTLLLPSSRAMRTVQEAFVRHFGAQDHAGMLMPRMAAVGDLDLDETLGSLLDPLGASDIPPAIDPTFRWLRLAQILAEQMADPPRGNALLRLSGEMARAMDRLLAEEIGPEELLHDRVLDLFERDLSEHWRRNLHLFATVQRLWLAELQERGEVDAAQRRNLLFRRAAKRWRAEPPSTPIVAAGVTSAAPALARLLRVVADLPQGAVILPDLDLSMEDAVWDELGIAGAPENAGDPPFGRSDAVTHPQYHLKLLLNRMGVARPEVRPWHRRGMTAADPDRSHALSSLFLPPAASRSWVDLPADKRRLAAVRLVEAANPEEEAQALALLVREALEVPERRIAVVTPDRNLAQRVARHLRRWNVQADDSAGTPLSSTPAGRLFLLLAEVASEEAAPVPLIALLEHPLVRFEDDRGAWLSQVRAFEKELRGPRPAPGLEPLAATAEAAGTAEWWGATAATLAPVLEDTTTLADALDRLATVGEALCGEHLWSREDGRALARLVEDLRMQARIVGTTLDRRDWHAVLRDAMEQVAVRPPYGGHPRVAIYGLLEARMARADLILCAGLNEGSWPQRSATDPLLAPPVLRALGVPGADFRIGLAAHDLAAMLGAPEVVLSRSDRDESGPAIPSRFLMRVRALLGEDLLHRHIDRTPVAWARAIDVPREKPPLYPRPEPRPQAKQRKVRLSVTAFDRLRADPFQFYASSILRLKEIDGLDADPTPAWQGEVAHAILERWHKGEGGLATIADQELSQMNAHPLTRALWRPRLLRALEWVEQTIAGDPDRVPHLVEAWGKMKVRDVEIIGRIDRLDRLSDGSFAVVDYKTGRPPSGAQAEAGYALQLGTLGLMVEAGGFDGAQGKASRFEYWSLGKSDRSGTGFGYVETPILEGRKRSGIEAEEFLPQARDFLDDALNRWILGDEPFTARLNPDAPGYATYDQLMRLDEWMGREQ